MADTTAPSWPALRRVLRRVPGLVWLAEFFWNTPGSWLYRRPTSAWLGDDALVSQLPRAYRRFARYCSAQRGNPVGAESLLRFIIWVRPVARLAACALALVLLATSRGHAPPSASGVFRSFDRVLLLEEKGETSAGVSVGDLNGDGLPDIVLGKGRHWPLYSRVLLNDGKGGFTSSNLGTAPDRTYSAALADIDHDGDLDIIVSNDAPDRKLVYRNDGKGHFTEAGTFGSPNWATSFAYSGKKPGP